jgi:hypothetical protein
MNFTLDELAALADLIAFHDDWDEVSEHVGCDVSELYDKVVDAMNTAGVK